MVEYTFDLGAVFSSLGDPTRRDIVRRLSERTMTVGTIASHYDLSFAGISKHLKVLERAKLVFKTRQGKEQLVSINPEALYAAHEHLELYRALWEQRFDALGNFLETQGSTHPEKD